MRNYKLIIAYDGTDFFGWQRQPDKRTVQGTLEDILARITQKKIAVAGAGRTDAGVHAQGQTANFRADITLKPKELLRAMNALLPGDIKILSIKKTVPDFHARKSALSKTYEYRIFTAGIISPFLSRYVLYWPYPLDIELMNEAAKLFEREADFSAFSSNRFLRPVRKVFRSEIRKKRNELLYTVEANGFLRYMVRTMVGTLLEVGRGKMSPEQVEEIFRKNDRSLAGPTAPAQGLCLVRVAY